MNTTVLASCLLAVIGCATAHSAGAGYVVAAREERSSKYAVLRSIISILLIGLAINMVIAR